MWKTVLAAVLLLIGTRVFAQSADQPDSPKLKITTGLASYYSDEYQGMATKSGELYNRSDLTGAHKTLPMGTRVRVTRLDDNRTVEVRINDRGPRAKDRVIDISGAAAERLGLVGAGLTQVRLDVLPTGGEPMVSKGASTPAAVPVAAARVEAPKGPIRISNTALYEVELKPSARAGYGVQVAYFTDYDKALKLVDDLKAKTREKVLLSVKQNATTNQEEYRVIVGSLDTQPQATALKARLGTEQQMAGFVVSLAQM